MDLSTVIRPNILALAPYSCARDEFKGEASVYIDANESPYKNGTNRYPDPLQPEVKRLLSQLKFVRPEQIFLGNGSDEAIDLIYRIFCQPRHDNVVAISPSYGMYKVCAEINDVQYREVSLTPDFQLDRNAVACRVDDRTKVLWFCSPNNPTGNAFDRQELVWFLEKFPQKIIVVDEAYIDFSSRGTMLDYLGQYDNLIVLQTLSKAWGQAAIRCGIAYASSDIIAYFNNVKYPYNVNQLTQQHAIEVLSHPEVLRAHVAEVLEQREALRQSLLQLPMVREVYPSDANFLLTRVDDANATYLALQQMGIIVRNRNSVHLCQGCLRITVGTPDENRQLIDALSKL